MGRCRRGKGWINKGKRNKRAPKIDRGAKRTSLAKGSEEIWRIEREIESRE